MPKGLIYFILFFLSTTFYAQSNRFKAQLDSIQELRQLSKNNDLDLDKRIFYAQEASKLSHKTKVDSVILNSYNNLISICITDKYFNGLKELSHKTLKLSKRLKDSTSMAQSFNALGMHYSSLNIGNKADSAYYYFYEAEKVYKSLNEHYNRAFVLFNLAKIQCFEKNYISSEITSIKAISILDNMRQANEVKKLKSFIYNNLGIIFNQLRQYKESIKYHKLSLNTKRKLKGSFQKNIDNSLNNLGNAYTEFGQYNKAIENYLKILKNKNLIKERPSFYAEVIDNYAYNLFLSSKYKQLPKLYLRALKICDSVEAQYRSIIIHQHLAEYYDYKKQKDSALYHGYKAKAISEQFYKDDVLKSLLILSKIEEDSIAIKHYDAYITLNDSIQHEQRLKRNKHTRIQFETDQYIRETKRLTTQNILIVVIGSILVFVLGLLYFIKTQRTKNKALVYEQIQQEANQEIYALMLQQHEKLETGRLLERHRISEDLHDGILSQLFGTRMGFGFLELTGDTQTLKQFKQLQQELQGIEKEVRDVSHELKNDSLVSKTSFETVLENYIKQQSAIGNFRYSIKKEKPLQFETIGNAIKVAVFRIVQEAIQNVIKHAKAKTITVFFKEKGNTLYVTISDDGIGFDAKTKHKGIGLKNIESRVSKLGGTFNIVSKPNPGTVVNIAVPI